MDMFARILFILLFAFMIVGAVSNYRGSRRAKVVVGILCTAACAFMYYLIFYLSPALCGG